MKRVIVDISCSRWCICLVGPERERERERVSERERERERDMEMEMEMDKGREQVVRARELVW